MKKLMEFIFGSRRQYRLRQATPADHALLVEMINKDEDHRGRIVPQLFYSEAAGIDSYVLEDETGVVFFFRMTRAVRLDIQFLTPATAAERERNQEALLEGFDWLRGMLAVRGIREVIFESRVSPLIRFCQKRLGFISSPNELRYVVPMTDDDMSLENPLQRLQGESRGTV